MSREGEKRGWDSPRRGRQVFWVIAAVCVALTLADLFYPKDWHFEWERWFGFFGFYGFVCCLFLVLAAKELRRILKRREDYYDRRDR